MNIKGLRATFLLLLLGVIFFSLTGINTSAIAKNFKSSEFLEFPQDQRDAFYSGAYMSIGHVISLKNKKQGQCVTDWYFKQPKQRITELENAMRKYPDHSPTSILIGLAQLECGKIYTE